MKYAVGDLCITCNAAVSPRNDGHLVTIVEVDVGRMAHALPPYRVRRLGAMPFPRTVFAGSPALHVDEHCEALGWESQLRPAARPTDRAAMRSTGSHAVEPSCPDATPLARETFSAPDVRLCTTP
jgi:hypothetical protein